MSKREPKPLLPLRVLRSLPKLLRLRAPQPPIDRIGLGKPISAVVNEQERFEAAARQRCLHEAR